MIGRGRGAVGDGGGRWGGGGGGGWGGYGGGGGGGASGRTGRGDTATWRRGDLASAADGNCAALCVIGQLCARAARSEFLAGQSQLRIRVFFLLSYAPFITSPIKLVGFWKSSQAGESSLRFEW